MAKTDKTSNIHNYLSDYIKEIDKIYRQGIATEHSYRPALKNLLENITTGLTITNEPKHIDCGAPDYIITRDSIPLGYIEAKDIVVGTNNKLNKPQFDRYKQSLGNLIITDYLTFQLFVEGQHLTSVTIASETGGNLKPDKNQFDSFIELINQFIQYSGKTICKSSELAVMMAAKAKLLAEVIKKALSDKSSAASGVHDTLSGQLEGFRKVLIHNIDDISFADMYAQTLAYGLFAARFNQSSTETFNREIAAHLIPKSNPFLRKFFQHIAFDLDNRIQWIVDALANLFNCVAVEDILKEFGKVNQDPFIHFYETFLAEYDPALRESRGVYYTPLSVVQFIVKAVDDILQKDFGLKQGLADNSTIKLPVITKDKQGNNVVTGEREFHKVQILDPAAGTGTFLAEIINIIHSRYSNQKGMWAGYCKEHLIPRLNGFEILMASYAMAHFKMDMTLKETGFTNDENSRLRVYLTNSLEDPDKEASKLPMVEWLTHEANEAQSIKKDTPVMVILGNPPYSGESENITADDFLAEYKKEPGGIEKLKEKNSKWINDDYVKFIRYGQNFIEKYGSGVLAFINNHSFIDNPTFRGMRWNLLKTFDKIYILDLHGNSKKKETTPDGSKDQNVFDIQQGVSINIFIKTDKKKSDKLADIFHTDMYGERESKNTLLLENTITSINWNKISPVHPYFFFTQKDFYNIEEYNEGFGIQELFPENSVGIVTSNDSIFINDSKILLKNNIEEYFKVDSNNKLIKSISYRPFDNQYIYYDTKKLERARENVMQHFNIGTNIGLIIGRQGQVVGSIPWSLCFVTKTITDFNLYYRGGGVVFPLYLYPDKNALDQTETRRPNLKPDIIKTIADKIKLSFTNEKIEDNKTFAPIDIIDYIYAVLHSPGYREKYKEFLKIDFPRVPYPNDAKQFKKLVKLGSQLREAHLLENVSPSDKLALYPIEGSNTIDKLIYKDEKVWINKDQYFEKVLRPAWEFYIGGYQPAQKWLKDRKERKLSFDEIQHYQKIINALCLTADLQKKVDEAMGDVTA